MPTSRHPLRFEAEKVTISREIASTAATATVHLYKVPAGRKFRLERVLYINPTGLALDAANAFKGEVKDGSTVMSTVFDTLTGDTGSAALAANTFREPTIVTAARVAAAADVVDFVATLSGTQTLPAGSIILEGRLY